MPPLNPVTIGLAVLLFAYFWAISNNTPPTA